MVVSSLSMKKKCLTSRRSWPGRGAALLKENEDLAEYCPLLKENDDLAEYWLQVQLTPGVKTQLFLQGVHNLPSKSLATCNDWKLPHINNQYSVLKGFTSKKKSYLYHSCT
jgi:hypothetical protein